MFQFATKKAGKFPAFFKFWVKNEVFSDKVY